MGRHGQRVTIICKHCNKSFEVQPHQPHVCSQCGKVYTPKKHTDQKYCSPECQASAQCSQVTISCETCGKEISVTESRAKRTKYCSKKCQMLSMFSSCDERRVVKIISDLLNEIPVKQHTWDWLTNPKSGRPLYIDAYFPQHNLAVEYDGRQHWQFVPFYHKTRQQFTELQYRDKVKECLLKQFGILLLRITSKEPKTDKYIATRLRQLLLPQ